MTLKIGLVQQLAAHKRTDIENLPPKGKIKRSKSNYQNLAHTYTAQI